MRKLAIFLILFFSLSGCAVSDFIKEQISPPPPVKRVSCAETRLNTSYSFYESAKKYFSSFFKTRKEAELFYAWYFTEDSTYMASSIRRCPDRRNKHFHAVRSLAYKNAVLKKLILQNMRLSDQGQMSEVFLEKYREIFPRDIQ